MRMIKGRDEVCMGATINEYKLLVGNPEGKRET
jgi:hypothetical protein